MKRDMDLIRKVLISLEEREDAGAGPLQIDGYDEPLISYHVMLLAEAGLIEATDMSGSNSIEWMPERLTWSGHEFLDLARSDKTWAVAKSRMASIGGFALDVMKALLIEIAKQQAKGLGFLP